MFSRLLLLIAILGVLSTSAATALPVLADSHTETVNLRVDGMV